MEYKGIDITKEEDFDIFTYKFDDGEELEIAFMISTKINNYENLKNLMYLIDNLFELYDSDEIKFFLGTITRIIKGVVKLNGSKEK